MTRFSFCATCCPQNSAFEMEIGGAINGTEENENPVCRITCVDIRISGSCGCQTE
jgi:hypothetical protein